MLRINTLRFPDKDTMVHLAVGGVLLTMFSLALTLMYFDTTRCVGCCGKYPVGTELVLFVVSKNFSNYDSWLGSENFVASEHPYVRLLLREPWQVPTLPLECKWIRNNTILCD